MALPTVSTSQGTTSNGLAQPQPSTPAAPSMASKLASTLSGEGQSTAVRAGKGFFWALSTASMGASAYHGYKRNDSIPWAIWWGFCGAVFPVFTPAIALAQGFGQKKRRRR